MSGKKGSTQIRWTGQELKLVADQTAANVLAHLGTFPKCLDAAQRQVLEKDRWRNCVSMLGPTSLNADFQKFYKKALHGAVDAPTPVLAAEPAPTQEPAPAGAQPLDALIDQLAHVVASRIITSIEDALRARVKHIVQTGADSGAVAAQQRRRKVLVVGALEGQSGMLRQEFDKLLDITAWTAEQALMMPTTGDYHTVLAMKDFMSHAATERLRAFGDKLRLVQGGMTHMRAALEEVFCV